jgi:hypothetical protein
MKRPQRIITWRTPCVCGGNSIGELVFTRIFSAREVMQINTLRVLFNKSAQSSKQQWRCPIIKE